MRVFGEFNINTSGLLERLSFFNSVDFTPTHWKMDVADGSYFSVLRALLRDLYHIPDELPKKDKDRLGWHHIRQEKKQFITIISAAEKELAEGLKETAAFNELFRERDFTRPNRDGVQIAARGNAFDMFASMATLGVFAPTRVLLERKAEYLRKMENSLHELLTGQERDREAVNVRQI